MRGHRGGSAQAWPWALVAVLFLLHHDFWYWDDPRIVAGFLPIGLCYHGLYTIVSGLVWFLVVRFAWPAELEEWAAQSKGGNAPQPTEH